jgi:glycerophosphoryl diester phosphodiesterase
VNFSYGGTTLTLHVFIKDPSETEYVLYEENFDYPSGALPNTFELKNNVGATGGSAAIDNGRLFLSPSTIVLFPDYLEGFSNYIIETDMKMISAANASRWTSVLFRYTTENYFQMAVRQDATASNGVEFAKRINGGWNVPATTSYAEALNPASTYRLKVDVKDAVVKESINDQLLITYDSAFEYKHGRIGVQADNVSVYYDNVRITLPEDYIEIERHQFRQVVDVYQPNTGIVAPATSLVWFNQASQLTQLQGAIRPATAIFRINQDLDIVDENGIVVDSLYNILIAIDGKVIPGFYTDDEAIATALGAELSIYGILDAFIFSNNEDAIIAARVEHSVLRGVMMYSFDENQELTEEDMMDIRRTTNRAQAVASVLPLHMVDREKVEYMQKRLMTVWVQADNDESSHYQAILSGANGIITQTYGKLFITYAKFPENTHVRRPFLIAHRGKFLGLESTAPENTIEAALQSAQNGADILELDVHLTSDFEVVIMHDNTTLRTAPDFPALTLASSTLAQLKAINLADPQGGREELKIPTLKEYFDALKDYDSVIFIEIKPNSANLVQQVAAIIEEYDMFDQTVMITFGASNITEMNDVYPDLSNGLLNSSIANAESVDASLTNLFSTIVPLKSTLNPSYGGVSHDFVDAIVHRGITIWPWTFNEYPVLNQYYNYGVGGLTTDYPGYYKDTFNRLVMKSYAKELNYEEAVGTKLGAELQTMTGFAYPYNPEYVMIDDGDTDIIFDERGEIISFVNPGTVTMMAMFESSLPDGSTINLVADFIEFTILELPVDPASEGLSTGWIIGISTSSLLVVAGIVFMIIRRKKII